MKKMLCIDVSGGVLRCVELTRERNEWKTGSGFTLDDAPRPDAALPDGAFRDRFQQAMRNSGLRQQNAVLYLHGPSVLTREPQIPPIPQKEILPFLRLNSADYFPVGIQDCVLDVRIEEKTSRGWRLSASAVPRKTAQAATAYLKRLGLKNAGFALYTPQMAKDGGVTESFAVASIFGNEIHIQMVENGRTILSRRERAGDGELIENQQLFGVFQRIDDYTRAAFDKSIYGEKLFVYAPRLMRAHYVLQLRDVFAQAVEDTTSHGPAAGTFGDLTGIPAAATVLTKDRLHASGPEKGTEGTGKTALAAAFALPAAALLLSLILGVLTPSVRLSRAQRAYAKMDALSYEAELYDRYKKSVSGEAPGRSTDSYNNHFMAFYGEVRGAIPPACTVKTVSVKEKSCTLTFLAPDKAAVSRALDALEGLHYAKAGNISDVKKKTDGWQFAVKFDYAAALLQEKGGDRQ